MAVFVDASALVALIAGESDAKALSLRLEQETDRLCSTVSVWETVASLVRSHALTVPEARDRVRRFLAELDLRFVAMGEAEYELAADAYARFGKGRHPAALNTGDCFAYACAKAHGARLLFKGDDFTRTDIVPA